MSLTTPSSRLIVRLTRVQAYLALGMIPLLGLFQQSLPLASPLANFVAVPVVTLSIVPLALLGVLICPLHSQLAGALWTVAALIWRYLWQYLAGLSTELPHCCCRWRRIRL